MNTGNTVKVWDPLVRVFHWSLVAAFAVAYLTEDDVMSVHVWAGYTVAGLVAFRLLWGLIGTRHARFSDFVYRPAAVKAYLRDMLLVRARRYLGHNPAGGAMVVALLLSLLATVATGVVVYGAAEHAGPLAASLAGTGKSAAHALKEIHEFFANFTLALVFAHVAGVLLSSLAHRENLVRAMFTGRKRALSSTELEETRICETEFDNSLRRPPLA